MTVALRTAPDAGGRQVLVSGRVADTITGRGLADATVELDYDASGSGDFRALPALLARRDDGWFAWHVAPAAVPPPSGATPALRLRASAPRYAAGSATISLAAADLALEEEPRTILGQPVRLTRLAAAPFARALHLSPGPVALEGIALIAGDPDTPADGASVTIISPPGVTVATGPGGVFRVPALPVAAVVSLRITHGGEVSNHDIRPDFATPLNRAVFAVPA